MKSFGKSVLNAIRSALNWLTGSSLRAFVFIFILALGIRVYSIRQIPVINLLPKQDRELSSIAMTLAETGRFADPYIIPTGPTAHLPPIPPAILAFIYSLFGRTNSAAYLFIGFLIVTTSVIVALLPWIADRLGAGRQAGFVGGLIGTFMIELEQPTHGEGLAALMLALMMMAFLKRWSNGQSTFTSALLLGLGSGISFHVQPALLPVFLGCMAFEVGWHRPKGKIASFIVLGLGVVLVCIPWAWRNYTVFHELFFIRDNFGLELRMGNTPGAAATFDAMDRQGHHYQHPRLDLVEAQKVRELGEPEYMQEALSESLAWIRANPLEFSKLTFMRGFHFWFGSLRLSPESVLVVVLTILAILGFRRVLQGLTLPQRMILLVPLLTYPLVYYLVPYMPRYRTPIDWILFLLAGIEIWGWITFIARRLAGSQTITVGRDPGTMELK